jgi:hypothetical protein
MHRRSREGEERPTATFPLIFDLPKTLASSGGGSASAARWRDLASEGEWRESKCEGRGVPSGGSRLITGIGELGLRWVASDAIGQRGRLLGAAFWAVSREHAGCVGGCRFHAESHRVQWLSRENGVRLGRRGAPRGWARVAVRRACDAMRACVRCRGRRSQGTREQRARSGRFGCSVDVGLARSGRGLRPRSSKTDSGNWFLGSSWVWRRGDGSRGGRWRVGSAGCPRWAWRRRRRRGVLELCLRTMGSGFGSLQGEGRLQGVKGGSRSKNRGRG